MSTRSELWKALVSTYMDMEIDQPNLKIVTLAQWALESNWAKSDLATKHMNFAGMKYRARMKDHAVAIDYVASDGVDTYCKFENIESFIRGYWHFIESGNYKDWAQYADDPIGYIAYLKQQHYAGDPNYVSKVARIYAKLAMELDDAEDVDRPDRSVFGDVVTPIFEPVPGAKHKKQGQYPNGLEGLIVHYDAYRIRRTGSSEENSDARSRHTIQMGDDNKYRYACISRTGRIFVPENWDWKNWGSHAGRSKCPETGRTWVSKYYVGIEMNNPGLLYESQDDGIFCPWYNSKLDSRDRVILDSRGRCYRRKATDEWYTKQEVRYASGGNIHAGYYLPYSEDQFEALVGIIAYLNENIGSFRIDRVFGHDEVSPKRKQDPGGALAFGSNLMTMEQFRAHIKQRLS